MCKYLEFELLHMSVYFDLSILPSERIYRNINKGYSVIDDDNFWDEIEYRISTHSDIQISKKLISGFAYGAFDINNFEEKDEIWNFLYFWAREKIEEGKYNFRNVMEILTQVIDKYDDRKAFMRDLLSITSEDDFSKLKMIYDYIHDYETVKQTINQRHVVCTTQMEKHLNNYFMKYDEVRTKCDSANDTLCQIFKKFMGIKKNKGNLEKLTCLAVHDKKIEVKEDKGVSKTPPKDLTFTQVILLKNTDEHSKIQPSVEIGYNIVSKDPIEPETRAELELGAGLMPHAESKTVSGLNPSAESDEGGVLEQDSGLESATELKPNGEFEQGVRFQSTDKLETSSVSKEDTILQKSGEQPQSPVKPELTESQDSNGLSGSDPLPKLTVSYPPIVIPENHSVLQVPATLEPVGSVLNTVVHQNGLNNAIKTNDSPKEKPPPEMYPFFSSTYTKAAGVLLFLGILIPMLILSVLFSKVQNRYFRKKKKPYHLYFDRTHVYPFYYDRMSEGKPYYKQNVGYYPLMIE
ncbi:variable surface protein [Plasmodium gonderi]|uniref:Variable surface protein n=1 Tax=Plasmodium gonderi TaxID=77519 RepID=A0A1Y1JQ89_PLAGO|nr:variable surface protein [Plasmodium gonderi]GAW84589.1 variable surface protein [Plasmodium gonderi]